MTTTSRSRIAFVLSLALLASVPALLHGHAVVYPKTSHTGAYERYVLRVPNEKDVATTRIEIRFPAGVKISAFADVSGWQLEVLTDSAKRIIGGVWTGSLLAHRFVALPFMAANPKDSTSLTWPVYQTYASGEKVEWTGGPGSKSPASVTVITPVAPARSVQPRGATFWIASVALMISLVSAGLSVRNQNTPHADTFS